MARRKATRYVHASHAYATAMQFGIEKAAPIVMVIDCKDLTDDRHVIMVLDREQALRIAKQITERIGKVTV